MTNHYEQSYGENDPLLDHAVDLYTTNMDRDLAYTLIAADILAQLSDNEPFAAHDYLQFVQAEYEYSLPAGTYRQWIDRPLADIYETYDNTDLVADSGAYLHAGFYVGIDVARRMLGTTDYNTYLSVAATELFEAIDGECDTYDSFIAQLREIGYAHVTGSERDIDARHTRSEFNFVLERLQKGMGIRENDFEMIDFTAGFGIAHIACNMAYQQQTGAS